MHRDTAKSASPPLQPTAERFNWHARARVFNACGKEQKRAKSTSGTSADGRLRDISDQTPAAALCAVYEAIAREQEFCLTSGVCADAPVLPTANGDAHFQCMSSGTSGAPRRVRRSQKSWIESFEINAALWQISATDSYAVLGQLSHSLALYGAAEALHLGADLHLLSGARPDRQMRALAAGSVNILYATPTQIRLLDEAAPEGTVPSLRLLLIGGAKLDPATRALAQALFPNTAIHEFYGASETSFITIAGADTPEGSVGCAYPGVEISILGADGQTLPVGETGEIWVRSPYLFSGYAMGDTTGDTRWDAGWLTVGEFGWRDRSGALYLSGRRGRMVTIADQNAFPEEVETCLLTLEGVARAAVLPESDTRRGHVFVACVQLDGQTCDTERLMARCRALLGPLKAPRRIELVADWPVLSSGKTDLAALSDLLSGARA